MRLGGNLTPTPLHSTPLHSVVSALGLLRSTDPLYEMFKKIPEAVR